MHVKVYKTKDGAFIHFNNLWAQNISWKLVDLKKTKTITKKR